MTLLEAAGNQIIVLRAYAAFSSRDEEERYRAMLAMRDCGDAARWCLQLALRQTGQPRIQFAAAIVLHWLGDHRGLLTLTEALKWRRPADSLLAPHLESAFVAIGSPDAVNALLTVWNMLPEWGDHELVKSSICRIWAALRNPAVLPALSAGALENPGRFEQTVSAFGELAIPILREMARSPHARRRTLSIQTLRNIPGSSAFGILTALLQDIDPSVRSIVPAALVRTGDRNSALAEIACALRRGFPSPDAITMLSETDPAERSDALTAMLEVWSPEPGDRTTAEIVLMALPLLLNSVADAQRVSAALCALLSRQVDPQVAAAAIQGLDQLHSRRAIVERPVLDCVYAHICHPNRSVRNLAATTLARMGEPFPVMVINFVDECRPQDSFFSQLQMILRGGKDAGQAASQAVQQVSRWWNRITTESARLETEGGVPTRSAAVSLADDPRLPDMLCRMLSGAVERTGVVRDVQDVEERASFIVLLLRALSRLGSPVARCAWRCTLQVLHMPVEALCPLGETGDQRIYETVTAAAAELLMTLYDQDSFGLLLEALYSSRTEVVRTAIAALGILGDGRALQHLRMLAGNDRHPCASVAASAVAQIRRTNPEMMSLLRGSAPTASGPDMLLRPARANVGIVSPDLLLRPAPENSD